MKAIILASALLLAPVPAAADDATNFALFWGSVLAIEDHCPQYYSRTDATMGGHLSGSDYQWAASQVDRMRDSAAKTVEQLGCDRAAEEAAKLMDYSFFYVWEVK